MGVLLAGDGHADATMKTDVVIAGAGFYGLTAAAICARRGHAYRIIEPGAAPLTTWRRMPQAMMTRSYIRHTAFPFAGLTLRDFLREYEGRSKRASQNAAEDDDSRSTAPPLHPRHAHRDLESEIPARHCQADTRGTALGADLPEADHETVSAATVVAYADWFVHRAGLAVDTLRTVTEVAPAETGLVVTLDGGERIETRRLVLATGLSRRAWIPPMWWPLADARGPCRHWHDVGDYDAFFGRAATILVIGGGQSGHEAAAAALRRNREVIHVMRSCPRVVPHRLEASIYHLHERFVTPVMNLLYRGDEVAAIRPIQRRMYDWLLAPSVAARALDGLTGPRYRPIVGEVTNVARDDKGYVVSVRGHRHVAGRVVLATGYRSIARQDPLVDALCQQGLVLPDECDTYLLTDRLFRSLADRRITITGHLAAPSQGPTCAFVAGLPKFRDAFEMTLHGDRAIMMSKRRRSGRRPPGPPARAERVSA